MAEVAGENRHLKVLTTIAMKGVLEMLAPHIQAALKKHGLVPVVERDSGQAS